MLKKEIEQVLALPYFYIWWSGLKYSLFKKSDDVYFACLELYDEKKRSRNFWSTRDVERLLERISILDIYTLKGPLHPCQIKEARKRVILNGCEYQMIGKLNGDHCTYELTYLRQL